MSTVICDQCGNGFEASAELLGCCPSCLFSQVVVDSVEPSKRLIEVRSATPAISDLATHFPQLDIQSRIGVGGASCVYRAHHKFLDRAVALKIILSAPSDSEDRLARFRNETAALAKLKHANIVEVYDAGVVESWFYIVMELVEGPNLRQVLGSEPLPIDETISIAKQLGDALQLAHDRGIVHLDVKPENVLLTRKGEVKLADFGLASASLWPPRSKQGQLTIGGTPNYIAPEHFVAPEQVNHRADIFAFGIVIHEMLTGRRPERLPEPRGLSAAVTPVVLNAIVQRAIDTQPQSRYPSVRSFLDAVELAMASHKTQIIDGSIRPAVKIPIQGWITAILSFFGSIVAFLLFLIACLNFVKSVTPGVLAYPSQWESLAYYGVSLLLGAIVARVSLLRQSRWRSVPFYLWPSIPSLWVVYLTLGILITYGPGLLLAILGFAPWFSERPEWQFLGATYDPASHAHWMTAYWLRVFGISLLVGSLWSIAVAWSVMRSPVSLLPLLHPCNEEELKWCAQSVRALALWLGIQASAVVILVSFLVK